MILPCCLFSFFYSAIWRKTTKHVIILVLVNYRISNFTQVFVLLFLSLGSSLVLWYHLNNKFLDILLYFLYKTMGSGNQHGGRECDDDLQNWLHMTSHENPYRRSSIKKTTLNNVSKCKQKLKVWSVICNFCSNYFGKWQCILLLKLYKDVYTGFIKHTFIGSSETKTYVTKTALIYFQVISVFLIG